MFESCPYDPLRTLCRSDAEVHREIVCNINTIGSECVASLGVLPVEHPIDTEFRNGYWPYVSEQIQLFPHRNVGGFDVRPRVAFLRCRRRAFEDHMTFL